tara:strand:- start:556 stop:1296 length:741 start_codon:yes stop_codon:yes gene_type:complete
MNYKYFLFILCFDLFSQINIQDLDYIRMLSNEDSQSIVISGTNFCNEYFKNIGLNSKEFKNFFMCKYSKKRDRFYIYMLAVDRKENISLKDFCNEVLNSWPDVKDHMQKKFNYREKKYLNGFYVDDIFNNKVIEFSNDFSKDIAIIDNEINRFIIENRFNFTNDNIENNKKIKKEIIKINKIYKKLITQSESDLDKLIKIHLNKIVRYKIFINDTKNFISYSCNWEPMKGIKPYVKKEKFSEFENI